MTGAAVGAASRAAYFNPHEREARDMAIQSLSRMNGYFNPHEREARDRGAYACTPYLIILIHTSVKLVTGFLYFWSYSGLF